MFQRAPFVLILLALASLALMGGGGLLVAKGEEIWMIAAGVATIIVGLIAGVVAVLGATENIV
ncbi:hypothetical protein [Caulobacter sp. NIBR2454]|uniref:hypothetical protein n=1 Tax=Caulobacter sp. NIBR2454 TaxID=3015996 RepID=UPI0022B6854F|nr:hypothetical protein [Caulobacter sp. NIBR2454]